uniref:Sema domain-containing protein n=1 Tax=Fundulus heteroclitus TaxID=8078 RepID=A0A3Q2QPT5_FUNHE
TTLLLSQDGERLYVGARDAVLALDVSHKDTVLLRSKLDWSPSEKDLEECSMKGKEMADCPNFIRVLQFLNSTHMYACGTFAFSPRCTYINSETLTMSFNTDEGRGRCPYDPYQRNTAIIVGKPIKLGGRVVMIWLLNDTALICGQWRCICFSKPINLFPLPYQSDIGGQRTLQRRWTTFAKAQLLCQAGSELPYNVIQDIDMLPPAEGASADDTLFYGIFTSQWAANSGRSAVCSFSLSEIKSVFAGNYKVLNRDTLHLRAFHVMLVSVSLNEVVRLHCPAASQLSQQLWERPNSRLSSDLYLHLKDGSLSFVATPATLGHYLCLSTENGYRQTMAIYHVKQKSSPMAQTPTSYTQLHTQSQLTTQAVARPGLHTSVGEAPKTTESRPAETKPSLSTRNIQVTTRQHGRNGTLWKESGNTEAEFPLLSARCPSYLKELVVVSVLLVLCLSLLITITLYVLRQHCRRRTAPATGTPSRNSDRRTPEEQKALRENEFVKHNGQGPLGGHASGLVCNGNFSDSTQNLPNTPF